MRTPVTKIVVKYKKNCFWCDEQLNKDNATWDHVIPKSQPESKGLKNNIVFSCEPCNNERGRVTAFLGCMRMGNITRRFLRITRIRDLSNKWAKIEQEKLGYSISDKLFTEIAVTYCKYTGRIV